NTLGLHTIIKAGPMHDRIPSDSNRNPDALVDGQVEVVETTTETDHRLANNLAAVASVVRLDDDRSEGGSYPGAEVKGMVDDVAGRIETVAHLHRLLAQGAKQSHLDCGKYLRDICESASQALDPQGRYALNFDLVENCHVSAPRMLTLGM